MSRASLVRHRHHLHPLAPGEGDIAVLLELQQSLPHRGSADAQLLADVVLGVDGPYPKPVEEDRLLDQAVCLFFIRGRGPHILSAKQLLCHKLSSRPMPAFPHLTIPGRPVSSGATYLLPGQRGLSGSRLPPRRGGRCCPPPVPLHMVLFPAGVLLPLRGPDGKTLPLVKRTAGLFSRYTWSVRLSRPSLARSSSARPIPLDRAARRTKSPAR